MLTVFLTGTANAKLHRGEVRLYIGDAWDFSDSSGGIWPTADITYAVTNASFRAAASPAADRVSTFTPALITYIGSDVGTYEDLENAPTDPGLYVTGLNAFPSDVLVVKTREGHYAKMLVLVPDGALVRFQYTYQDDGTTSFTVPVATAHVTWGRIKSLYK